MSLNNKFMITDFADCLNDFKNNLLKKYFE